MTTFDWPFGWYETAAAVFFLYYVIPKAQARRFQRYDSARRVEFEWEVRKTLGQWSI